jgi:hypothetical protein
MDGCLPLVLYRTWDSALSAYVSDENVPRLPSDHVTERPTLAAEPSVSSLEGAMAAGAAIALWGAWEYRSRRGDRRLWHTFLGR